MSSVNTNTNLKPKIDRTKYIIQDKKSETITRASGEIDGFNFKLRNLDNCTIYLLDWTKGMFIDDCTNCKFVIGPCDGSIFMRTSKNCEVSLISKQLRFRDCQNLKIFTYCTSDPVVENSCLISFAPFNISFPNLKELFIKANFNQMENKYKSVYDFSDGKNINNSKHWEIMDECEYNYEYVGNECKMQCEPIYESYLAEIKHLFKEPLGQDSKSINENDANDVALIQSENTDNIDIIEDSVKFSNNPINFQDENDVKADIIQGNSGNILGDYFNEGGPSASIGSIQKKEDGRHRKAIDISSTFDFTNSMIYSENVAVPTLAASKTQSGNYFKLNLSNVDNKIGESKEISSNIIENNSDQNKLNSNNEGLNYFLNSNNNSVNVKNFEINNNYLKDMQGDSPKNSEGSGDIVIIDSNPKVLNEILHVNKNEIANDFFVVNSFSSDSPNDNIDNNSPIENFEVLENEDIDETEDDQDIKATRRLLKDTQEKFKKIREIQEKEMNLKAEIRLKAQEFINNFNKRKTTEEKKIKNRNEEHLYLTSKNIKHANPWNRIIDLIEIKESRNPGNKDISRMREMIISRKQDYDSNKNINKNLSPKK